MKSQSEKKMDPGQARYPGQDCQGTTAGMDTLQLVFPSSHSSGFTDPGEKGQMSQLGSYDQLS